LLREIVAHALVGVLKTTEQINDLAFTPNGEALAVVDRAGMTSLWTVTDSAVRTQLSGIDSRPSSLAFSNDGILAGGGGVAMSGSGARVGARKSVHRFLCRRRTATSRASLRLGRPWCHLRLAARLPRDRRPDHPRLL